MEQENNIIELRSEKVRNIIGVIPPVLLRYGITIIGLSLLSLIGISAFIPYQYSVGVNIKITHNDKGKLEYLGIIPIEYIGESGQFMDVTLDTSLEPFFPSKFEIITISDKVHLSDKGLFQAVIIKPIKEIKLNNIYLDNSITVPAKINFKKCSFLKWVISRV